MLQEVGVDLISPTYGSYHILEGVEQMLRELSTNVGENNYNIYYRRAMMSTSVLGIQGFVPFVENLDRVAFELVVKHMSWLWI